MRRLIRADGTEQIIGKVSTTEARRLIGADALCVVALRHLGDPLQVMLVGDDTYESELVVHRPGYFELRPLLALQPVNRQATALYRANCRPGTTHQITGDVVIVFDDDFD